MTRRDFLSLTVTAAGLAVVAGCGGGGGSNIETVLALTEALGYTVEYDPDRAIGNTPYVNALTQNGQTVMEGDIFFTVNGQQFFDSGSAGDKSVNSSVNAGDIIAWQTF
ncbi:MAG: hypothetical protein WD970_00630 [Patescibacteria group bacterium]